MKTKQQILDGIRAREAGKTASRDGLKMDANPHHESSELHWDWLDAWCVEESSKRAQHPQNDQGMAAARCGSNKLEGLQPSPSPPCSSSSELLTDSEND